MIASRARLILVLSHFPGWRPPELTCPWGCEVTMDHARRDAADALVCHLPTWRGFPVISKRPGQRLVALSLESEVNCPLLNEPGFMRQFDIVMSYRRDATIHCAYLDPAILPRLDVPPPPKTAEVPLVCFISNASDRCGRTAYLAQLMRRIQVHSYGKVMRNRGLLLDRGRDTRLAVMARYRFVLAFENSICPDYVTEKFFDPLAAGSVPVYRGAPNIADFAPGEGCFVDASTFPGPGELAEHIARLAADQAAYARFFAWKKAPLAPGFVALAEAQRASGWQRLCQLLHGERGP